MGKYDTTDIYEINYWILYSYQSVNLTFVTLSNSGKNTGKEIQKKKCILKLIYAFK